MRFEQLPIEGAYLIGLDVIRDDRGSFARTFSREEFMDMGLDAHVEQCNVSFNARAGTLRGLHYQQDPYAEAKLIRCTRGAVFDVAVDLRQVSTSFRAIATVELTADDNRLVYWPGGVAHGFLTLGDNTELTYQMSQPYVPESGRGVRWDDPAFAIEWPRSVEVISPRDAAFPDYVG